MRADGTFLAKYKTIIILASDAGNILKKNATNFAKVPIFFLEIFLNSLNEYEPSALL